MTLPSPADLATAETRLGGVRFPADYRTWLSLVNGLSGWCGEMFVRLFSLADVVLITEAAQPAGRLPGFVAIGSDGAGELLAYDFRRAEPPLVLLDPTAGGWADGVTQAASFAEFLAWCERGEPFTLTGAPRRLENPGAPPPGRSARAIEFGDPSPGSWRMQW